MKDSGDPRNPGKDELIRRRDLRVVILTGSHGMRLPVFLH